jgi:hypothetical protein
METALCMEKELRNLKQEVLNDTHAIKVCAYASAWRVLIPLQEYELERGKLGMSHIEYCFAYIIISFL